MTPFSWPKSRDYVPFVNAPHESLTVEKAVQNWVQYEGNVFRFPGGGTQFRNGADAYIDQLASVIPIENGTVRTALDTGCGVASWGAYLFKKKVLTMCFAPRDSHEAQVQFALERGVPPVIGVLGTIKLPYPSRSFDMAHCSRRLIPWGANDGLYMMEVDRVLRPGGYWVLSGPPINWRTNYQAWQRPKEELKEEQIKIEEMAELLCWEKKHEKGEIAIWRERVNNENCRERYSRVTLCESSNVGNVWDKKMEACVTPYPQTTNSDEVAGGELKPFPNRLNAVPPRIASGFVPGLSVDSFKEDNKNGRHCNIMDMNSGLGSFAAALESPKLWIMNVLPTIAEQDALGVVYERGLIGIYHDCFLFHLLSGVKLSLPTPGTYDLIHANGVFSLYKDKCNAEDILLEMYRILRAEGAIILRDQIMRWNTKMVDHEDGPLIPEKVVFAVKKYLVVGDNNSTVSD
ncbi:unnamed protein product [Withania somnifera]